MSGPNKKALTGQAFVTYGLGFGDESKGATVDWLCRRLNAALVVRYGGGPQAAHHVVLPDGRWHCFAQFGSGSLAGVPTRLAPSMLVEIEALYEEGLALERLGLDPWRLLTVDPDCHLVTPMNKMVNQLSEITAGRPAGSCGMGVGDAHYDRLAGRGVTVREMTRPGPAYRTLDRLAFAKMNEAIRLKEQHRGNAEARETLQYFAKRCRADHLAVRYWSLLNGGRISLARKPVLTAVRRQLTRGRNVVFEGAQGALLDPRLGWPPHVTKTPCTGDEADRYIPAGATVTRVGILRAYLTRHGAGPFPTEDPSLAARLTDRFNRHGRWQGPMRYGWLDLPLLRRALAANPPTDWLAVSCLDQLSGLPEIRVCLAHDATGSPGEWLILRGWRKPLGHCRRWADLPPNCRRYLAFLASPNGLNTPIGLIGLGPTAANRLYLL